MGFWYVNYVLDIRYASQRFVSLSTRFICILIYLQTNADHSISKYVMQESQYTSVHAIALYYQMETRRSIRQVLRDSCAFISIIDKKAMNVLANSVLPMELAR